MHQHERRTPDHSEGFTLIELLVVIIIIGILAAIAIPIFLNQRKKAVDASMKSDLQTVAQNEETYMVDQLQYAPLSGTAPSYTLGTGVDQIPVTASPGNVLTVTPDAYGVGTYCIVADNARGSQPWVYKSTAGGIQGLGTTSC